jgi:hypothetical protein
MAELGPDDRDCPDCQMVSPLKMEQGPQTWPSRPWNWRVLANSWSYLGLICLNPLWLRLTQSTVRRGDAGLEDVLTKLCNMRFPEARCFERYVLFFVFFCVKLSPGLFCWDFGNSEVKWNFSGGQSVKGWPLADHRPRLYQGHTLNGQIDLWEKERWTDGLNTRTQAIFMMRHVFWRAPCLYIYSHYVDAHFATPWFLYQRSLGKKPFWAGASAETSAALRFKGASPAECIGRPMITPWSNSLKFFFGFPKSIFEHWTVAHNRVTRVGHFLLVPVLSPTLADKLMLDVNTLVLVPSTAANGNMLKLCTI